MSATISSVVVFPRSEEFSPGVARVVSAACRVVREVRERPRTEEVYEDEWGGYELDRIHRRSFGAPEGFRTTVVLESRVGGAWEHLESAVRSLLP